MRSERRARTRVVSLPEGTTLGAKRPVFPGPWPGNRYVTAASGASSGHPVPLLVNPRSGGSRVRAPGARTTHPRPSAEGSPGKVQPSPRRRGDSEDRGYAVRSEGLARR